MIYAAITPDVKAPALALLVSAMGNQTDLAPGWYKNRIVRIAFQNLLRSRGFGEAYFQVDSLNDIYLPLVEEALKTSQN